MFGDRLKKLRLDAGLTQAQLATQLEISASAVGMYEQNRREPSNELLIKICKLFDISLDWIISGENISKSGLVLSPRCDLGSVLDELKCHLKTQDGLMFNGKVIDSEDIEQIFNAMRLGAEIATSNGKRIKHDNKTS